MKGIFIGRMFGFFLGSLALSASAQNGPATARYIVALNPGEQPAKVAAAHGLTPRHVYGHVLNGFSAEIPPGRLAALANDLAVAHVAVDNQIFIVAKPAPPPPPPPPGQVVPAGVVRIGAQGLAQTGLGIGVAIVDTGLDFNHTDLAVSSSSFVSPGFAYTTSAQDDHGHGTHVGGIVAALNNSQDVVGVAPQATLYAVKVLDNSGSGSDSDVISGLDWVAANATLQTPHIRVINMSLGRTASSDDSLMHAAVQAVTAAGVAVVVAAGNDASLEVLQTVPAGFPEVIAVASTTAKAGTTNNKRIGSIQADTASFFTTDGKYDSTTGVGVSISAPGEEEEDIAYPFVNSLGILSLKLGGGTTRMSGTSMAAPHTTGVVALLLEKSPALTPPQVKDRIRNGDREGKAPLDSPTTSYTFDNEREGILYAPIVLGP